MTRLLLLFVLLSSQVFGQGGLGSVVLPGNATCANEYINVSPCGGLTTLTYNGYTYDLVEIGGQCWFAENLQTTKYSDGSPIDYPGTNNTTWQLNTTGAYAWYDNDSITYAPDYGALYNWYAVDNAAGLCPTGWHVATDCEWMYLEGTLGMSTTWQQNTGTRGTDEGDKLRDTGTTHWGSPNTGATNSSGFTGLPGSKRSYNGTFPSIGLNARLWSSTKVSTTSWHRGLDSGGGVFRASANRATGKSVRCLKSCLPTYGTDTQTACDSYTWMDGNTYTSNNNTATHTLTNAAGCDSVVTLNLTINNNTGMDVQTACDSFTWIDSTTYTTSNYTATDTLTNVAGCDSVVTLNLTINNNTGTDTQTACDSYTWMDGNTYTSNNNTATHTLTNAAGCDSVVTLDLTSNSSSTGTDTQTACDSYTWIDGITYTANNTTATDTLTNNDGCDSVVTLNLTINNSTTENDTIIYFVSDSNLIDVSPVIYLDSVVNLTTTLGCDSIINHYSEYIFDATFCTDTTEVFDTTYVTVTDTNWVNDTTFVTDTTEVFDTTYVTVTDTNWVNDTTFVTDTTEVFDTTYVTVNDTVLISVTDTLIIDVTLTGVSPPNNTNTLKVYPNPAKDQLYIDNGDYLSMSGYTLKIINSVGQDVFSSLITIPLFVIDISTLGSTGLYFIQVIDGSSNVLENKKLVLE